jgi:hypothetical protein
MFICNLVRWNKATRFGLVVRGLGSIHDVLGSILIGNIVNQKKSSLLEIGMTLSSKDSYYAFWILSPYRYKQISASMK